MSLIFAQLQMAEMERHEQQAGRTQFFFEPEALAVDSDEFAALEDRVIRAVELLKQERNDRATAEKRALQAEAELNFQLPRIEALEQELHVFKERQRTWTPAHRTVAEPTRRRPGLSRQARPEEPRRSQSSQTALIPPYRAPIAQRV